METFKHFFVTLLQKNEMLMLCAWSPWPWIKDSPATCRLTCLRGLSAQHRPALFIWPPEAFPPQKNCILLQFGSTTFVLLQVIAQPSLPETVWQTAELLYIKSSGFTCSSAHFTEVASFPLSTPVCFPLLTRGNGCFVCATTDLQSATLDTIFSWIMLRNINESLRLATFEKTMPRNSVRGYCKNQ